MAHKETTTRRASVFRSIRVGRIGGTPISVDGGLAVLAAVFIASLTVQGLAELDPQASLGSRLGVATVTVLVFLTSILAHELGHATVAKRYGVGVLGITLSLFGGYAQLDRQAPTPRAEFAIAAAGPAVNLVLGTILGGISYGLFQADLAGRLAIGSIGWLAGVNIVLALLNLVPAAPLDGGRVLTAGLWKRHGDAELARIISGRTGLILGVLVATAGLVVVVQADGLFGQWQGAVMLIVGLFLFNGARGEIGTAAIRRRLSRTTTRELMIADPVPVSDSLTVEQFHRLIGDRDRGVVHPVVRWTSDPIGYVAPSAGAGLDGLDRGRTTVLDLMQPIPEVARAWMTEPIDDVLKRLGRPRDLLVVVHEPEAGRVVGTIGQTQVQPLLEPPDLWGRDRKRREQPASTAG